jgi:hypothetical protein
MADAALPQCFVCQFEAAGYPCRRADGAGLDYARIARDTVRSGRAFHGETIDEALYAETRWANDCVFEMEEEHPEHLLALVIAAIDACETLEDLSYIAAGPLENMVVKHGPRVISDIERLASKSAKFRYALSGIWSQGGSVDKGVWERIGLAVARGGRMSNDGRGPWDGNPVTVLDAAAALKLLREERVGEIARTLGLIE